MGCSARLCTAFVVLGTHLLRMTSLTLLGDVHGLFSDLRRHLVKEHALNNCARISSAHSRQRSHPGSFVPRLRFFSS